MAVTAENLPLTLVEATSEVRNKLEPETPAVKEALTPTPGRSVTLTKTLLDGANSELLKGKSEISFTFKSGDSLTSLLCYDHYGKGYNSLSQDQKYFIVTLDLILSQQGVNANEFREGDKISFNFETSKFEKKPASGATKGGDLVIQGLSDQPTVKAKEDLSGLLDDLASKISLYDVLSRYNDQAGANIDLSYQGRVNYIRDHDGFADLINHYLGGKTGEYLDKTGSNFNYKKTANQDQNLAYIKAFIRYQRFLKLDEALPTGITMAKGEEVMPEPVLPVKVPEVVNTPAIEAVEAIRLTPEQQLFGILPAAKEIFEKIDALSAEFDTFKAAHPQPLDESGKTKLIGLEREAADLLQRLIAQQAPLNKLVGGKDRDAAVVQEMRRTLQDKITAAGNLISAMQDYGKTPKVEVPVEEQIGTPLVTEQTVITEPPVVSAPPEVTPEPIAPLPAVTEVAETEAGGKLEKISSTIDGIGVKLEALNDRVIAFTETVGDSLDRDQIKEANSLLKAISKLLAELNKQQALLAAVEVDENTKDSERKLAIQSKLNLVSETGIALIDSINGIVTSRAPESRVEEPVEETQNLVVTTEPLPDPESQEAIEAELDAAMKHVNPKETPYEDMTPAEKLESLSTDISDLGKRLGILQGKFNDYDSHFGMPPTDKQKRKLNDLGEAFAELKRDLEAKRDAVLKITTTTEEDTEYKNTLIQTIDLKLGYLEPFIPKIEDRKTATAKVAQPSQSGQPINMEGLSVKARKAAEKKEEERKEVEVAFEIAKTELEAVTLPPPGTDLAETSGTIDLDKLEEAYEKAMAAVEKGAVATPKVYERGASVARNRGDIGAYFARKEKQKGLLELYPSAAADVQREMNETQNIYGKVTFTFPEGYTGEDAVRDLALKVSPGSRFNDTDHPNDAAAFAYAQDQILHSTGTSVEVYLPVTGRYTMNGGKDFTVGNVTNNPDGKTINVASDGTATEVIPGAAPAIQEAAPDINTSEFVRLSEEMAILAKRNAWTGVNDNYVLAMAVKPEGVMAPNELHVQYLGAQAARALGHIEDVFDRLNKACALQDNANATDRIDSLRWLEDLKTSYGKVAISVEGKGPHELSAKLLPFAPDKRSAIEGAQNAIRDARGLVEWHLPVGEYTLDGKTFTVQSMAENILLQVMGVTAKETRAERRADRREANLVDLREGLTMPTLANDLPDGAAEEIQRDWDRIELSTIAEPFYATSGREYIRTEEGVFYNSKPLEKNSFGKIDEDGSTYFLLDGKLLRGEGVGSRWDDSYFLYKVPGRETVFDNHGKALEQEGKLWKQTDKDGYTSYYSAPSYMLCDLEGKTENDLRSQILDRLQKAVPKLKMVGENFVLDVNTEGLGDLKVSYAGTMLFENGVAKVRIWSNGAEEFYPLDVFEMVVREKAKLLAQTIPFLLITRDPSDANVATPAYYNAEVQLYNLNEQLGDNREQGIHANNVLWHTVVTHGNPVSYESVKLYAEWLENNNPNISNIDTLMDYYKLSGNAEKAQEFARKALEGIDATTTDAQLIEVRKKATEILK